MTYPIQVIPSRVWRHKTDHSRIASIYGSHPDPDHRNNWEIVQVGWTVQNNDGTVGVCKPPWKDRKDAEAYLKKYGYRTLTFTSNQFDFFQQKIIDSIKNLYDDLSEDDVTITELHQMLESLCVRFELDFKQVIKNNTSNYERMQMLKRFPHFEQYIEFDS